MFLGRKLFAQRYAVAAFAANVRRNVSINAAQKSLTTISIPYSFSWIIGSVFIVGYCVNSSNTAVVAQCDHHRLNASEISAAKKEISKLIEAEDEKRGDGTSIGPTIVRLAWHASGTYSVNDKTGGSNGSTMRLTPECAWGANAGLETTRKFLEPVATKFGMSHADVWTLAGVTAIEYMGGPNINWKSGRTDSPKPTNVPDGRLPSANCGSSANNIAHIRAIFGRMGFDDRETVALIGAHAVGRCHTDASGFWGPWTYAEATFSNEYFRLLLEEKWTVKRTHEGKPWTGPLQYESPDGALMMLPSDLALVEDPEFKKIVQQYAKDEKAFFDDFARAFSKLLELGVPFP